MKYGDYVDRHAPRLPAVLLRFYLGGFFIYRAVTFFTSGMVNKGVFDQRLQELLAYRQLPVLGSYFELLGGIRTEVLASAVLAVYLMVGMSFVLGLHTRLFGLLGLVFLLHTYCLGYLGPPSGEAAMVARHTLALRLNEALMVGFVVVLLTAAGRSWGVDGLVWRGQLKREFTYPESPDLDVLKTRPRPEPDATPPTEDE